MVKTFVCHICQWQFKCKTKFSNFHLANYLVLCNFWSTTTIWTFRDDNVSSINMKECPRMSFPKSHRRSLITKHFRDDDFKLSAMTCGTHYILLFNTHTWSGGLLLLSDDKNANFPKMKEWWLSDNHGKNISSLVSHIWPAFKFVNNTSIAICLC